MNPLTSILSNFFGKVAVGFLAVLSVVTSSAVPIAKPDVTASIQDQQLKQYSQQLEDLKAKVQELSNENKLGAAITVSVARFETSLAAALSATATSTTLVSGTDAAGNALAGYIGFTINEGATNEETIACTAAGTALSNCIRGISPTDGDLEVTALKKTHRRGESVKITDHPLVTIIARILNGDETIPNALKYNSTSTAAFTDGSYVVNKQYVDNTAFNGAPDASTVTKGLGEIATCAELASSTATGGTTAPLVARSTCFASTPSATTTVPVTNASGTLPTGFIAQDAGAFYSFLGGVTSASSTLNGTTRLGTSTFSVIPTIPTSTPSASSSVASRNYVDGLTYLRVATGTIADNTDVATSGAGGTVTSSTITHGLGYVPHMLALSFNIFAANNPNSAETRTIGNLVFDGSGAAIGGFCIVDKEGVDSSGADSSASQTTCNATGQGATALENITVTADNITSSTFRFKITGILSGSDPGASTVSQITWRAF